MELIQNVLEFPNLNPSFNLNKLEREIVLTIWINSLRAKNKGKGHFRPGCSVRWICIVFKYLLFLEIFPIKSFLFSSSLTVFFIIYLNKTPDHSVKTGKLRWKSSLSLKFPCLWIENPEQRLERGGAGYLNLNKQKN